MEPPPESKPVRPARGGTLKWPLVAANVALLAILGLSASTHLLKARQMPRAFHVVEPARLYRSGQPTPEQLTNVIKEYGIHTVINLCAPRAADYVDDVPTARAYGVRVVSLPISSVKLLTDEQLATLRRTYEDPRNYPILVHCEAGHARTGVAVALWRIERQGWDPAKAVEEMTASGYPIRDKNSEMREVLTHWRSPAADGKAEAASAPTSNEATEHAAGPAGE